MGHPVYFSGLVESGVEARPGLVKGFGEDAGFADYGHEIGIGEPARKSVHVDVSGDSGTGSFADVHPEVHTFRMVETT